MLLEHSMIRPWTTFRRAALTLALGAAAAALLASAVAAQSDFPFGSELMLDVKPMKGSKRVPMLDIDQKGLAEIDLWCNSVKGQLVVAGDTITIITGEKTERSCPPERAQADDEVLGALNEVTSWRREGDILVLIGTRTMRFRLQTN
jgi:heat shock protein HslJ